jgi:hypothetical protein
MLSGLEGICAVMIVVVLDPIEVNKGLQSPLIHFHIYRFVQSNGLEISPKSD